MRPTIPFWSNFSRVAVADYWSLKKKLNAFQTPEKKHPREKKTQQKQLVKHVRLMISTLLMKSLKMAWLLRGTPWIFVTQSPKNSVTTRKEMDQFSVRTHGIVLVVARLLWKRKHTVDRDALQSSPAYDNVGCDFNTFFLISPAVRPKSCFFCEQ